MTQYSQFFYHHWHQFAVFFIILVLVLLNEWMEHLKKVKSISPQQAIDQINHENAVVIDLREQEVFAKGHIINAVRMHQKDLTVERITKFKNKPLILVCGRGIESESASKQFKNNPQVKLSVLAGGMTAWQTAGLPVVKGNK